MDFSLHSTPGLNAHQTKNASNSYSKRHASHTIYKNIYQLPYEISRNPLQLLVTTSTTKLRQIRRNTKFPIEQN